MNDTYLATLMKKTKIGENIFIFHPIQVISGFYNNNQQTFLDDSGFEYLAITDTALLYSEEEYAFCNAIVYDDLKKLLDVDYDLPIVEFKNQYLSHYIDIVFIVKIENQKVNYQMININPVAKESIKYQETEETDTEVILIGENDEVVESLDNLVSDITNGKYNIEELKDMYKEFSVTIENFTKLKEVLENKLEIDRQESLLNQKEKKKESTSNIINISSLYNKIKETVIDQDEPILRLITEIVRMELPGNEKKGILLTGSTGVGKTLTMDLIAQNINRDFLCVDSTQLTTVGHVGKSIEEILWELYLKCEKDIERTENAIIYFDEIDKKGSSKKSDIAGQGVLHSLLKFMDGTDYTACQNTQMVTPATSKVINTSNMLVIIGGAFIDVYGNLKQNNCGFSSSTNIEKKEPDIDDFVEKAMIPKELMGRCPIVVHMNDLTVNSMKRILLLKSSPLKLEENNFKVLGVALEYAEDYLEAVSEKAYESKSGARGIKKIISDTTWQAFAEVCRNIGKYEKVILTKETVKDNREYQLVPKEKEEKLTNKTYQLKRDNF